MCTWGSGWKSVLRGRGAPGRPQGQCSEPSTEPPTSIPSCRAVPTQSAFVAASSFLLGATCRRISISSLPLRQARVQDPGPGRAAAVGIGVTVDVAVGRAAEADDAVFHHLKCSLPSGEARRKGGVLRCGLIGRVQLWITLLSACAATRGGRPSQRRQRGCAKCDRPPAAPLLAWTAQTSSQPCFSGPAHESLAAGRAGSNSRWANRAVQYCRAHSPG